MNIRLGDKVKFIDEVGGGIIVGLNNSLVTVEDEHGFQYEVPESSVILNQKVDYSAKQIKSEESSPKEILKAEKREVDPSIIAYLRPAKIPFLEVDLHIQHLMLDNQRLSSHDMVLIQMQEVKKIFELTKKFRYTKIIYIHGVGAGRLKSEIRSFLTKKSNCEFFDASFQTYGYGATEVRVWYN